MRKKFCDICNKDWKKMYRITYKSDCKWVFVCKDCLLNVKKDNFHYRYGGTWKR